MAFGVGEAQHMRRERHLRIEALLFARKIEPDIADGIHRRHLIGQRAATDIGRARPRQLGEQFLARHVGKDLVQFVGEILAVVEQFRRHHSDRIAVDRPSERHAIAIDDIGARGHEGRAVAAAAGIAVEQRKIEQPHRNEEKCRHEQQHEHHQPLLRGQQYLLPHPSGSNPGRTDDQRVHWPDLPSFASRAAARLRSASVDSARS